jgi:hypothetical protein
MAQVVLKLPGIFGDAGIAIHSAAVLTVAADALRKD